MAPAARKGLRPENERSIKMNSDTIFALIFSISVVQFLLIWLPLYMDFSDYTNNGKDVIWITKNRELNWFFTLFLLPHAIMYERLCERINGNGLAILLLLLSLATLPMTLLMSLIGAITVIIRALWWCFCRTFARKEEP